MCCGSSDTSFFCAACSRAWACSSRSRRSLYSLFHASLLLSNSSTSAILCTVLGSFGYGFSCCQRSPSSRTRRTFSSAFLSSSMLARISTSLCAGPLFIGPPLVTSGVGHLTLRSTLRRSHGGRTPSSALPAAGPDAPLHRLLELLQVYAPPGIPLHLLCERPLPAAG